MTEHTVSPRTYVLVFLTLLALLILTIAAAYIDLGPLRTPVALAIAVAKALLIILFFMHVRYSSRLTWAFVGAGFFWLLLLMVLTMSDFATRG